MGNLENKHPAFNENVMAIGHNLQIANSHHFNKLSFGEKRKKKFQLTQQEKQIYMELI